MKKGARNPEASAGKAKLRKFMKNYSSNRAQKGKTAYRTPDRFIYKMALKSVKNKAKTPRR